MIGDLEQPSPENQGERGKIGNLELTRRQFIKLSLLAMATFGLTPIIKLGADREVQTGVEAALARPEMKGIGERLEPSLSTMLEVYQEYFKGKESILSLEAWVRIEKEGKNEKMRGVGAYLGILANQYYESEKEPEENFDSFYKKFVDRLHELSEIAGLDFTTLVVSLQISAENIAGFEAPKKASNIDVYISRIQEIGITIGRELGMESFFLKPLSVGGLLSVIMNKAEKAGLKLPFEEIIPKEGIRHYDLIRFREQPTTGLMDFEPGERSKAVIYLRDNPLTKKLQTEYPEVYESYINADERRNEVTKIRKRLESAAEDFIERFSDVLKPFAEGNEEALNKIGISPEMDFWQLSNYTDVWYKASEIPTNPEFCYQRTVEYFKEEAEKNREEFYKRFFSQQIRNPKFLQYLKKHVSSKEMLETVMRISSLVKEYELKAKDLRIAHFDILKKEGRYEYDSKFQQIMTILVTKRLSDMAGNFDPNDKNSIGWHIYKTCAIREISPIPFLVDPEPFAADITIDPPYAPEALIEALETFAIMLQRAQIIQQPPDKDIKAFYEVMEKMFWRDGGVWYGANPTKEQAKTWEPILSYFNRYIANRLFYDFVGLLQDKQQMKELNELMIKAGLITKPAHEDPYNFLTQFVYLALDSYHMRRDIPKEKWDEVEAYFKEKIMPLVITQEEIAPGVLRGRWNIGSADYPPIFRAQAVMYNFLIRKNPQRPLSNLSIIV
jgi:hypothetical protein